MTPAKWLKLQSDSGSEASAAKTIWLWACAATPQSRPAASGTTDAFHSCFGTQLLIKELIEEGDLPSGNRWLGSVNQDVSGQYLSFYWQKAKQYNLTTA